MILRGDITDRASTHLGEVRDGDALLVEPLLGGARVLKRHDLVRGAVVDEQRRLLLHHEPAAANARGSRGGTRGGCA